MAWEMSFLYDLQAIHTPFLDQLMVALSTLGNAGLFWILLSVLLSIIPKTRKCGLMMMASMLLTFILGNLLIKNLVARTRPFMLDETVQLLVKKPSEYSFPSGHTMNGFAAALMLFFHYRIPGTMALILAAGIAFSRMYLFVHYPTDILGGVFLGCLDTILVILLVKKWMNRKQSKLDA